MCTEKSETKTKINALIEALNRLSTELERLHHNAQVITDFLIEFHNDERSVL